MILIATGLKREAQILAGPGRVVVAGGGDGGRLSRELSHAAAQAEAIISLGLCGALAGGSQPGDWVVASSVVSGASGRIFSCDPEWTATLARRLRARAGAVVGSDAIVADALSKQVLHAATGALAVDMESHLAAQVAAERGLPFAVARVVSDGADRNLPKAAQAGMAADGRMDLLSVLRSLAANPRQLPDLVRVGVEAGAAFRSLSRGRDLLGPRLGRLDLGQLALDVV